MHSLYSNTHFPYEHRMRFWQLVTPSPINIKPHACANDDGGKVMMPKRIACFAIDVFRCEWAPECDLYRVENRS